MASQAKVCVNNQRMLAAAFEQYALENGEGAKNWSDVVGEGKLIATMPVCLLGGTYNAEREQSGGYKVTCTIPSHDPVSAAAQRGAAATESAH